MDHSKRDQMPVKVIADAIETVTNQVNYRLKGIGSGSMASVQEIVGVLRGELMIFETDLARGTSSLENTEASLSRLAASAIFGLASSRYGKLKW